MRFRTLWLLAASLLVSVAIAPATSASEDLEATLDVETGEAAKGERFVFDATGSSGSADIVSYEWDWDVDKGAGFYDTSTSEGLVEHAFSSSGQHTVEVRVEDADGDHATAQVTVRVDENTAPSPHFDWEPYGAGLGEQVTFDASRSEDSEGAVIEYRWDFDGDGIFEQITSQPTIQTSFEEAGAHEVTLQVLDEERAAKELRREVDVDGDAYAPRVTVSVDPTEPEVGQRITIDGIGTQDPDGEVVAMRFDTDGDGETDYRADGPSSIRTTYASPGEVEVTIQAEDDEGRVGVATTTLTVQGASAGEDAPVSNETEDAAPEAGQQSEEASTEPQDAPSSAAPTEDDAAAPAREEDEGAQTSGDEGAAEEAQAQQVPGPGLGLTLLATGALALARRSAGRELTALEPEHADEAGDGGDRE